MPQELVDLLKEIKKEERKKASVKQDGRLGMIDIGDKSDHKSTEDQNQRQSAGVASLDDLADGKVNKMPATSIDVLFGNRTIKNVSHRKASNAVNHNQAPVTARLSDLSQREIKSFS